MHRDLQATFDRERVVQRGGVPDEWLDRALRTADVVRPFPHTYLETAFADDDSATIAAALRYVGGGAAISHTSGLRRYGLPVPSGLPLHITTGRERQPRAKEGLVVHRRSDYRTDFPAVRRCYGLPTVALERCLIESWPSLLRGYPPDVARAPLIIAVRERLTTVDRITAEFVGHPRLPGRVRLAHVIDLLRQGCRSELEIWGHARIFGHPAMPQSVAQYPLRLADRTVYLDRAFLLEMVDVELDGAKYHYSREQRHRDERRDAAVAALGWLPVRLGHDRLYDEEDAARWDLMAILARRRSQLGIAS